MTARERGCSSKLIEKRMLPSSRPWAGTRNHWCFRLCYAGAAFCFVTNIDGYRPAFAGRRVYRAPACQGHPMPAFPTATTVLDSILFRDAFGTPAMREVFSDLALISRYVEVEIALAKAEARCGVIPQQAADEIAARTDVAALDFDALRRETDVVGYPILPLVHQMARQCGEAGRYVHWGATTQDIMDSALVLQLRAGLAIIE